jgi:hypothetical protein
MYKIKHVLYRYFPHIEACEVRSSYVQVYLIHSISSISSLSIGKIKLINARSVSGVLHHPCYVHTPQQETHPVVLCILQREVIAYDAHILLHKDGTFALLLQSVHHGRNVAGSFVKRIPCQLCCVQQQYMQKCKNFE